MKYEVDKISGYLKVDRPQRTSAQHPALYGFVPQDLLRRRARAASSRPGAKRGDGDPLDICVLTERPITRAEIIVRCTRNGRPADDRSRRGRRQDHRRARERLVWGAAHRPRQRAAGADRAAAALLPDLQARAGPALRWRGSTRYMAAITPSRSSARRWRITRRRFSA